MRPRHTCLGKLDVNAIGAIFVAASMRPRRTSLGKRCVSITTSSWQSSRFNEAEAHVPWKTLRIQLFLKHSLLVSKRPGHACLEKRYAARCSSRIIFSFNEAEAHV